MRLVLFDIDGTLLTSEGAGVIAMRQTLREFFGLDGAPEGYTMAGKVDAQIVSELLTHGGHDALAARARLNDYWAVYAAELARAVTTRRVTPLPGVLPLLAALRTDPAVLLGLLTGNLAAAARIKLQAGGIDPDQFLVAAYGHEAFSRPELPALALERAVALTGLSFDGTSIVIIGDTPSDITCGEALGVRTIGVATGSYTTDQLRAAGATFVFTDLSDTAAVLAAIAHA